MEIIFKVPFVFGVVWYAIAWHKPYFILNTCMINNTPLPSRYSPEL